MGLQSFVPGGTVEQRSELSYEEFMEEYALKQRPVAILHQMNDWPAIRKWTMPFFVERYGHVNVTTSRGKVAGKEFWETTVAEYAQYMDTSEEEEAFYLSNWTFEKNHPELLADYWVPGYLRNALDVFPLDRRPSWKWLFIGADRSGSSLHQDTMNSAAWLGLISGTKEWVLFPPSDTPFLYDGEVDIFADNLLDNHPLLEQTQPTYYRQVSGEILFVPSLWWHQIENTGVCVAVTENFVNESNVSQFRDFLVANSLHGSLRRLLNRYPEYRGMGFVARKV